MFLPFVFCLLFLQSTFGSPLPENAEDPEWLPRFGRDFEIFDSDHWYKWWYGGKRKSTVQERIQTLETRQKVLFDLVLCESHNRIRTFVTDECELFRSKAEQVFAIPSKGDPITPSGGGGSDAKIKPVTTITPVVPQKITAIGDPQVTTSVPQDTTIISTSASTAIPPVSITTLVSSSTLET